MVCNLFNALCLAVSGAFSSVFFDNEANKGGRRGGRFRRGNDDQTCDKGGSAYDEFTGDYGTTTYTNGRGNNGMRYSPQ